MDTEEDVELKKARRNGRPETDEGPHYHESWWESYKGSVKGKLGGIVIGAAMGAAIGLAAAVVLPLVGAGVGMAGALISGFAAAGMLYGAHEFSEVGKITGAVAAAHEISERRMKSFEAEKFSELKQEIGELKAIASGQSPAEAKRSAAIAAKQQAHDPNYRTTHCDEHCPPNGKLVFWKVAAIGLVVGLAAGALLVSGGAAGQLLHALGSAAPALEGAGLYAASMTALGLFGASFGVNRDAFRQVFDKTDLYFRGLLKRNGKQPAIEQAVATQPVKPMAAPSFENYVNVPDSETHFRDRYPQRDKILPAAERALLSFDHTSATLH